MVCGKNAIFGSLNIKSTYVLLVYWCERYMQRQLPHSLL